MMRVLYPGSFDPITKGHMNIIEQACALFDEIVIAVLANPNKNSSYFTLQERIDIIKELYKDNPQVKVVTGNEASIDIALKYGCEAIVRGLRNLTDFEYEIQLAQVNREISNYKVNTVCLVADSRLQTVSSSMVKEVFMYNKDISRYVDQLVAEKMYAKEK